MRRTRQQQSYRQYSNSFGCYFPLIGGTALLAATCKQKEVEAAGFRGESGYLPYDCSYRSQFKKQAKQALEATETFRKHVCSGSYSAYKSKKLEEIESRLRANFEQKFKNEVLSPYKSKKEALVSRMQDCIGLRDMCVEEIREKEEHLRALSSRLEQLRTELATHLEKIEEVRSESTELDTILYYSYDTIKNACAKLCVLCVEGIMPREIREIREKEKEEEEVAKQALFQLIDHTSAEIENTALLFFNCLQEIEEIEGKKSKLLEEEHYYLAQTPLLDERYKSDVKAFKELEEKIIRETLEETEALYSLESYKKLLMELGTPVLVGLLWAQDQSVYITENHSSSCFWTLGLSASSCSRYEWNVDLYKEYYSQFEKEICEIRDMLEVPHTANWEDKVDAFLEGGAKSLLLFTIAEAALTIPGVQPVAVAVIVLQQGISWGEYFFDYDNYCKKEEAKIQQELFVRALRADEYSIEKAQEWGSWTVSTIMTIDSLCSLANGAQEQALNDLESKALAKAEARSLAKEESKILAKAGTKALAKEESKALAKAGTKALAKEESKALAKAGTKALAKEESKALAKAGTKALAKEESKALAKAGTKALAKKEAKKQYKKRLEAEVQKQIKAKNKELFKAGTKTGAKSLAKQGVEASASSVSKKAAKLLSMLESSSSNPQQAANFLNAKYNLPSNARFRSFTKGNYPWNFKILTSLSKNPKLKEMLLKESHQIHHIIPQQFFKQCAQAGVNLHDPRLLSWLEVDLHRKVHSAGYNAWWESFFEANDNPTKEQIFQAVAEMIEKYGFFVPGFCF